MSIDNPEAVNFTLQKIRRVASHALELYKFCKFVTLEWHATNVSTLITDTSDLIENGTPADGGHQITGAEANTIISVAQNICSLCENNDNAILNKLLKAARRDV